MTVVVAIEKGEIDLPLFHFFVVSILYQQSEMFAKMEKSYDFQNADIFWGKVDVHIMAFRFCVLEVDDFFDRDMAKNI